MEPCEVHHQCGLVIRCADAEMSQFTRLAEETCAEVVCEQSFCGAGSFDERRRQHVDSDTVALGFHRHCSGEDDDRCHCGADDGFAWCGHLCSVGSDVDDAP